MRYPHFALTAMSMLLVVLALVDTTPSVALQAPRVSLDMVTASNAYDEATNSMHLGPVDRCLETPLPGAVTQHNHTTHVTVHEVEDLIGWQARLNYDGGRMRPLSVNFTPFIDNTTGQSVSLVNLPIDSATGVHRDIATATSIPPQAPGPQSALIGSVYSGEQTAPLSADSPAKSPPDDTSYSAPNGGVLAAINLQVLAGQAGQPSLYIDLDDGNPNAPGTSVVFFTESGSASIDVSEGQLSDGFHGEGAACVPISPPAPPPILPDQGPGPGIQQADYDGDGYDDALEDYVGTDPVRACGVNAWPADIFHDRISDTKDISRLTAYFGKRVPPAPVRFDMAPNTAIDTGDIARITGFFGKTCETFGTDNDNATYAITGTPFGGYWASSSEPTTDPAVHHRVECEPLNSGGYSPQPACNTRWGPGNWSIDYYGFNVAVQYSTPFTSAPVTSQVWAIYPTCAGPGGASIAGSTVFIDVYVNGKWQGWRSFGHLGNVQVNPGQIIGQNTVLGYTQHWGDIPGCYEVVTDSGVHVHYEEYNAREAACYWSYTRGQFMNYSTNFGTIGRTIYIGPRQPC